jgi:hypothetical protein
MAKLTRDAVHSMLKATEDSFPHARDVCSTCECFLGYLAQLRIDSDLTDKDLFTPFKVDRKEMHHCLGCDPCPPGDLYAEYMQKKAAQIPSPILGAPKGVLREGLGRCTELVEV